MRTLIFLLNFKVLTRTKKFFFTQIFRKKEKNFIKLLRYVSYKKITNVDILNIIRSKRAHYLHLYTVLTQLLKKCIYDEIY